MKLWDDSNEFWNDQRKESNRTWLNAKLWLIVAALAMIVAYLIQY